MFNNNINYANSHSEALNLTGEVTVISLDYDNCLAKENIKLNYENYIDHIIESNKNLLDHMLAVTENSTEVKILTGSNRQSPYLDQLNDNSNNNGSCFPVLEAVSKEVNKRSGKENCSFDGLLLYDIYKKLPAGETLRLFNKNDSSISEFLTEKIVGYKGNKCTFIYAQAHYAASLHSKKNVNFHFYDDNDDILNTLYFYFGSGDSLPENLILHIWKYEGKDVCKISSIQGKAEIDVSYEETTRTMLVPDEPPVISYQDKDLTGKQVHGDIRDDGFKILDHAIFLGAIINNSYFSVCSLTEASFEGVKEATKTKFFTCKLDGAKFQHGNFEEASFHNVALNGANFQGTNLRNAQFIVKKKSSDWTINTISASDDGFFEVQDSMENCIFEKSDLEAAKFNNCNLSGANFQGANLKGTLFNNCDLTGANFQGADNLRSCDFDKCVLKEVKFIDFTGMSQADIKPQWLQEQLTKLAEDLKNHKQKEPLVDVIFHNIMGEIKRMDLKDQEGLLECAKSHNMFKKTYFLPVVGPQTFLGAKIDLQCPTKYQKQIDANIKHVKRQQEVNSYV